MKYEVVFILNESIVVSDEVDNFSKDFSDRISKLGGSIIEKNVLGSKKFARTLKKKYNFGFYLHFIFILENRSSIIELNSSYKLDERIIRKMFLVCTRDDKKKLQDR